LSAKFSRVVKQPENEIKALRFHPNGRSATRLVEKSLARSAVASARSTSADIDAESAPPRIAQGGAAVITAYLLDDGSLENSENWNLRNYDAGHVHVGRYR
jgi:hypothetical protein